MLSFFALALGLDSGSIIALGIFGATLSTSLILLKVKQRLLAFGFYYLELDKPDLGKVRIYTMQAKNRTVGNKIFQGLKKTLDQGGGVESFLKFEVTKNLFDEFC